MKVEYKAMKINDGRFQVLINVDDESVGLMTLTEEQWNEWKDAKEYMEVVHEVP